MIIRPIFDNFPQKVIINPKIKLFTAISLSIATAIAEAATNAIAGSSDGIPWRQRCHFFAMSNEGSSWH